MPAEDKLQRLHELKALSELGGGQARIDAQHARGKLTARERLKLLLDDDSFEEFDALAITLEAELGVEKQVAYGDAVVTGAGLIDGRRVFVFSQDFTVFGGSVSEVVGEKIVKVMDMAAKTGAPIIGLNDSGGARIQEGVVSLGAYGEIFLRNVLLSGVIPQISVILGPCAGGAVYSPAITDFIFMVQDTSQMFITGPDVIERVTGEQVTHEELGGASTHASKSGVAHFAVEGEEDCLLEVRRLLSFLPPNNRDDAPILSPSDDPRRSAEDLAEIVPDDPMRPYDVRDVINRIIDEADFLEVHEHFAPNIVVGFARMDGKTVGIVGNQPLHLAGVLDVDSSRKAARFVRFCDAFNIPIITLVDVPGFLPGVDQEHTGIITHGSKLVYAYAEATVPKVTLILRKGFGGAYVAMGSKHLRGDINFAWPIAQVAVMGGEQAVNVIYRSEIQSAPDPDARRKELVAEYDERYANAWTAAARGYVDDVIEPKDTRWRIIRALRMLENKVDMTPPKKHGNVPL
jgi:propionyl-CoA carboxylase beta chain